MRPFVTALLLFCCLLAATPARAGDGDEPETFVSLATRSGVSVAASLILPQNPRAAVILLAGGAGVLNITDSGGSARIRVDGNFLVRSRRLFAGRGMAVLTLDAPSDQSGGMGAGFRFSEEHARDLAAAAAWLRARTGLKPWLTGTSMGSISAANAAARLGEGDIGGAVLTSSVVKAGKRWDVAASRSDGVLDAGLARIRVPVLVLRHRDDACALSAPAGGARILDALTAAPRKALMTIEGGLPAQSDACEAKSAHGYLGVEEAAVAAIADFILLDAPR